MAADVVGISSARARKALPHDVDAEASVLGGILLRNDLLEQLPTLEIDDFYIPQHRIVFEAMRNLESASKPIDVVTLEHEIERRGMLDALGGNAAFFGELAYRVPTAENVLEYAGIVQQASRRRKAIIGLSSALERAQNWPHDPSEMISEVLGDLQVLQDASKPPAKRLKLLSIAQALDEREQLANAPVYPTPFDTLNDAIGFGGFLGTQSYTVVGGTGRGKTSFVAGVGSHTAQQGIPTLVISYEMKPLYFVARRASGLLSVHSNEIIRGHISTSLVLQAMPYPCMYLMHKPTLREVRDAVQFLCDKYGHAPLVIVDYIQKLADEISMTMQRPDLRIATSQASATLLDIADRTRCAMLTVSAVGRGKAQLKTPRKFDPYELVEVAKESGAVEYDGAGMIVLSLSKETEGDERIGTITVAKARFGRELHIDARYHGARGTWRDLGEVATDEGKATVTTVKPSFSNVLETNEDSVRARIVSELQRQPARNKTALKERVTGCRKAVVGALISRMIDEGIIAEIGGGLTLSPSGRQLLIDPVVSS